MKNSTNNDKLNSGTKVCINRLIALAGVAGLMQSTSFAKSVVGANSGPKRGDGGDIYDLRPFQDGDDPRQIDPAASARSGRTQLRTRHEQVDRTTLLVADFRAPMLWGSKGRLRSVAAAEALALEGWQIVAGGGQVGCMCSWDGGSEVRAPQPRKAAMLGISELLARTHALAFENAMTQSQTASPDLDEIIERATVLAKAGSDVVLATGYDQPGRNFAIALGALARKCHVSVRLVQDPLEVAPPDGLFSTRILGRVVRGRFSASSSQSLLEALHVDVQPVQTSQSIEMALSA